MHFIRRAALRAASSSATFVSRPRTINAPSPFLLRSSNAKLMSPSVFRRFASDDANAGRFDDFEGDNESTTPTSSGSFNDASDFSGGGRSNAGDYTRPTFEPTTGCYIGNLLFDVTEEDLRREFSPFGTLKDIRLTRDARGLSKGFAYIEYDTVEAATAAIENKDQTVWEGRRLVVNYINRAPRNRETNPPSKSLFIGNLAFEMSDADLNALFRDIRNVVDVRVAIDRRTGQPRGFAHADFVDVDSAVKAHEQLTGKIVFDRALRVDFSTGERTPGGRAGGPGGGAGGSGRPSGGNGGRF